MKNFLAIVIPAYKANFFEQTLSSIVEQTSKNFTLYIGDDSRGNEIEKIVKKFERKLPIVYHHFSENLGEWDLVGQWTRCIDLVSDEKFIWLFSDDDKMDKRCVEAFYETVEKFPDYDLYHFDVIQINNHDEIIGSFTPFPEILSVEKFLYYRLDSKQHLNSFVVDYIFQASIYHEKGGFHNLDLGWWSDDATWIKFGREKGIKTIRGANIYWRKSDSNISSQNSDLSIINRKFQAYFEFSAWILEQNKKGEIKNCENWIIIKLLERFDQTIKFNVRSLPLNKIIKYYKKYINVLSIKYKNKLKFKIIYFFIYRMYKIYS